MKLSNQAQFKKNINKLISRWYSIPLIDRWLLGQIIPPMVFAISAFTVISLSVGVMFDLIRKIVEFGLPLFLALKVLFLTYFKFFIIKNNLLNNNFILVSKSLIFYNVIQNNTNQIISF